MEPAGKRAGQPPKRDLAPTTTQGLKFCLYMEKDNHGHSPNNVSNIPFLRLVVSPTQFDLCPTHPSFTLIVTEEDEEGMWNYLHKWPAEELRRKLTILDPMRLLGPQSKWREAKMLIEHHLNLELTDLNESYADLKADQTANQDVDAGADTEIEESAAESDSNEQRQ